MTDCAGCGEPMAAICIECTRAAALRDWGGIARHPEEVDDQPCRLCRAGRPVLCPVCWPDEVLRYRRALAETDPIHYGHLVGP